MARRKLTIPTEQKAIRLPKPLIDRIDRLLIDAFSNKPTYGKWGELCETLLIQWADKEEARRQANFKELTITEETK